ncbi:MAG: hypothetical protein EG826_05110 [Deltaproteobacteria bacterium]|nr:hypothetical protein [Deltaproteobacteria bacterium]
MKKLFMVLTAVFLMMITVGGTAWALTLTITDDGRKLESSVPFLVAKCGPGDSDCDGVLQEFEDAVLQRLNPKFELDEDEPWLRNRSVDKAVNFGRVTVYPSREDPKYLLVNFAVTWSRDYGRDTLPGRGPYIDYYNKVIAIKHNGDVERITEAWEIVDNRTARLKWVYMSAHSGESLHSGVWSAQGESCNPGKVKLAVDQNLCARVQFEDNRVKVQASEGKHAIYPTVKVCEDVRLVATIGEDCGGGGTHLFSVYNAGEPDHPLMDDINAIFPGEKIWTATDFCGSKRTSSYNPALPCIGHRIGSSLEDPDGKLKTMLTAVAAKKHTPLPAGRYKESCDTISYDADNDRLTAHCKRKNGSWNNSANHVGGQQCIRQGGELANCDGNIDCINVNLPNVGSYKNSCWCCRMDGDTLRCHCNKKGSGSNWTGLSHARQYRDIWNDNGHLKGR